MDNTHAKKLSQKGRAIDASSHSGRGRGAASHRGRGAMAGGRGAMAGGSDNQGGPSGALVPMGRGTDQALLAPPGYTARVVKPAENYDVVSFARAMNQDDFGPRVKKLFDPEREAAEIAMKTGVYVVWRCPEFKHDCQRLYPGSKCFCGHLLNEHAEYNGHSVRVPCRQSPCKCVAFAWVPQRPEDVGEFWFQRRRNFDPSTWRAKCRCKHAHDEHEPTGMRRCKTKGCGCQVFNSNFLCAACDRHWEQHETFFETMEVRRQNGMPVGEEFFPFYEIPSLRNMVLTGQDDKDMSWMRLQDKSMFVPRPDPPPGNQAPMPLAGKGNDRYMGLGFPLGGRPQDKMTITELPPDENPQAGKGAGRSKR